MRHKLALCYSCKSECNPNCNQIKGWCNMLQSELKDHPLIEDFEVVEMPDNEEIFNKENVYGEKEANTVDEIVSKETLSDRPYLLFKGLGKRMIFYGTSYPELKHFVLQNLQNNMVQFNETVPKKKVIEHMSLNDESGGIPNWIFLIGTLLILFIILLIIHFVIGGDEESDEGGD